MNLDKNLFKSDYIAEAREILDSLDDIALQAAKKTRNTSFLKEILRLLPVAFVHSSADLCNRGYSTQTV